MEAPLRWLAEGYCQTFIGFLLFHGFPSVPGLLNRIPKKTPFPISRRRQLCQVRDCGVFTTFLFFIYIIYSLLACVPVPCISLSLSVCVCVL
ncbi:hypothetical protein F4810DRAFT_643725 [Camillea tinctor]|nr:hypothetical protein F4810DRAFT_643725 [Camillea tinctor]